MDFPVLTALVNPAEDVVRSRLYFRCSSYEDYYFVDLENESGGFTGVAPQAEESCPAVHYYVEALTRDFTSSRTPERVAEVTSDTECRRRGLTSAVFPGDDPRIVLGSTVAGPQLAPGFKGLGVASFMSSTGAIASAGGSSGVSAGVIAGVAAGGAAAGVGILVASGSSDSPSAGPTGGSSTTPPGTSTPPIAAPPPSPSEDVEACFTLNLPTPVVEVQEVVTIDGRCSSGGTGLLYHYDLGDGRVREGQAFVTVTWPEPGVYNLRLTVSRAPTTIGRALATVDEDTVSRTITVRDSSTGTPVPTGEPTGADLALTKTVNPSTVDSGDMFTWSITVTNLGPQTAQNVLVMDQTDTGPDLYDSPFECDSNGGEETGYSIECSLGDLAPGASRTLRIDMFAPFTEGSETFENDATATADTTDPNESNNNDSAAITVLPPAPPSADIGVTKTPLTQTVFGGVATWTLQVTNHGPDFASGVVLMDWLPLGFDFGEGSPPNGCNDTPTEGGVLVTCDIGNLQASETATVRLDVQAPFIQGSQTFVNNASVSSATDDPNSANDSASAMVTVSQAPASRTSKSSLTSDLLALPRDGATVGNVLLNGEALATTTNASPYRYAFTGAPGKNVIEANLLASESGEVLWRFDFTTAEGFEPGGFVVESGQIVSQDARSIVFRLEGSGQRIRFSFTLASR